MDKINIKFQGKLFTVYDETLDTPSGQTVTYERCSRPPSVVIIPFLDEKNILILKEYRISLGKKTWRLPAGRVDEAIKLNRELDPQNSDDLKIIKKAAQRELQEEAGYRAEKLELYHNRYQGESIKAPTHVFIARDLTKDPLPQDEEEYIETHKISLEKAYQMALSGEIEEELMALCIIKLQKK